MNCQGQFSRGNKKIFQYASAANFTHAKSVKVIWMQLTSNCLSLDNTNVLMDFSRAVEDSEKLFWNFVDILY